MKLLDLMNVPLADITLATFMEWLTSTKHDRDIRPREVNIKNFDSVKRELLKKIQGNHIMLYRAIPIFYQSDVYDSIMLLKYNIGKSWTHNINSARVYITSNPEYEDQYILVSNVHIDDVDWFATLALNMKSVRGKFEEEVRLAKGRTIKLLDVLDFDKKLSITNVANRIKGQAFVV